MDEARSSLGSLAPFLVIGVLLVVAVVLVVAAVVAFRARRDSSRATGSRPWLVLLRMVCEEAGSAVDQLVPHRNTRELPATLVLTAVVTRLRRLEDPLTEIIRQAPPRASEAAEDVAQVALALRTALQAERTGRINGGSASASRAASTRLVLERTAELEMAIQAARRVILEG